MHVWFVCTESMHITRYRIAPRCTSKCPPLHGQGPPICQHSHPSHQRLTSQMERTHQPSSTYHVSETLLVYCPKVKKGSHEGTSQQHVEHPARWRKKERENSQGAWSSPKDSLQSIRAIQGRWERGGDHGWSPVPILLSYNIKRERQRGKWTNAGNATPGLNATTWLCQAWLQGFWTRPLNSSGISQCEKLNQKNPHPNTGNPCQRKDRSYTYPRWNPIDSVPVCSSYIAAR